MLSVIEWINDATNKASDFILAPFNSLPGFLKLLLLIGVIFLAVIGLIRVARKALKVVIGIAAAFVILLIVWLIFIK